MGKLKKGVTNLVTRQQDTSELTQEQGVDRYAQVLSVQFLCQNRVYTRLLVCESMCANKTMDTRLHGRNAHAAGTTLLRDTHSLRKDVGQYIPKHSGKMMELSMMSGPMARVSA